MGFFLTHYEKIKLGIVLLLLASLPFHIHISSVLIITGAVVTLVKSFYSKQYNFLTIDKLSIGLLCYFMLEVIGLFYTEHENIGAGLSTIEKHQALVLIPLIFFDFELHEKNAATALSLFVASRYLRSLICVFFNFYDSYTIYEKFIHEWLFSHDRLSEPIGMQAVYFAMYLSLCVLIILFKLKEGWFIFSNRKKALLVILILWFFVFIVALGARTMIVALMLTIMGNLIYHALIFRAYKILIVATLVPLIFAGLIFLNPVVTTRFMDLRHSNAQETNYDSYFARINIWKPGLEAIGENLWFGVGTGDDQTELNKKYLKFGYKDGIEFNFNMHNQYLQTMLNLGVVGLVIFLSISVLQFGRGFLKRDLLYLSFLSLFMAGCLTESMLSRNKGIIFFLAFSFTFYKSMKEGDSEIRKI